MAKVLFVNLTRKTIFEFGCVSIQKKSYKNCFPRNEGMSSLNFLKQKQKVLHTFTNLLLFDRRHVKEQTKIIEVGQSNALRNVQQTEHHLPFPSACFVLLRFLSVTFFFFPFIFFPFFVHFDTDVQDQASCSYILDQIRFLLLFPSISSLQEYPTFRINYITWREATNTGKCGTWRPASP